MASPVNSVVDYVRALISENVISLAIKASLIFAGAMIVLVAVCFVMFGATHGLSEALGVELWFGFLITGSGFLLSTLLLFMVISYKAKREALIKEAEQVKAVEILSQTISEVVDVRKWTRKYPFYTTGAAAAVGFTASGIKMPSTDIQKSIIAMTLALAEDVVKEAVVPFVKEHLTDTQEVIQ